MAEVVLGACCYRAMVESRPVVVELKDGLSSVTVHVRYRRKDTIFPVVVKSNSHYFEKITQLRLGDEMYVSYDGEDITEVKLNPLWKRLWLRMIW